MEGNEFQHKADVEQRAVQATQMSVILENSKKAADLLDTLVKAVKTQGERITALTAEVKALKKK